MVATLISDHQICVRLEKYIIPVLLTAKKKQLGLF